MKNNNNETTTKTVLINLYNQHQVIHFPCIMDTHNAVYWINVDFILDFLCMYYIIIINIMSTCAEKPERLESMKKKYIWCGGFQKKKNMRIWSSIYDTTKPQELTQSRTSLNITVWGRFFVRTWTSILYPNKKFKTVQFRSAHSMLKYCTSPIIF